jgi:farnesyl diphosphate synthase
MSAAARTAAPDSHGVFVARLRQTAEEIEALLTQLLGNAGLPHEYARPARLLAAMRHAALDGGKRFRPFLLAECAALFDVPRARALMAGAALECVHCYSLVHDDLPAMDNDALRRGKPAVHKAFDDATAILAGDALLTLAFDILARPDTHPDAATRSALILNLARAAGLGGMAGGQMLDLAAEGRFADFAPPRDAKAVALLQAMKTGALIRHACIAGGLLGAASESECAALMEYGAAAGEAFQIADDLLDLTGDAQTLGKAAHKDDVAGKVTLVSLLGPARAREHLDALVNRAADALSCFGSRSSILIEAAHFVAYRRA